jgi:hypothetical protein
MKIEILWDYILWWPVNADILGNVLTVTSASSSLGSVTSLKIRNFFLWKISIVLDFHGIYFIDEYNKLLI